MNDAPQRERIRTDLDTSLIVEAAAGTGKTTELVARIIRVLAEGRAKMNQLVAVTFTEKAAGELKLRLRSELERTRARTTDEDQRINLGEALAHLEEAQLNTIHGFCLDLLRERPVEARVDPGFQPMDDAESERLYGEAFDAWMQKELDHPREGVRRALRRKSFGSGPEKESAPAERLRQAGWDLLQWRDLPGKWRRDAFDRQSSVDVLVTQIKEYAELTGRGCPLPLRLFRDFVTAAERTRSPRSPQYYDDLEARLVELARDRALTRPPTGLARLKRELLTEAHEKLTTALKAFARAADADLAALLRDEIWETLDAYNHLKAERGRLDFLDLLLLARDLIRDKDVVRAGFQKRFTHLFVDEFQDTDPLQAEILLLLVADDPRQRDWRDVTPVPGKLFLVGDPKQAIYRFRRADVGVYQEVKTLLCGRGVVHLTLTTSFRATPTIQNAVNYAFGPLMDGNAETLQAGYVPLAQHRGDPGGQPSLVALSVPSPYGKMRFSEAAVEACLPETIGGFIEWMIRESGWTVEDEGGQLVPVAARHVCLLFRKTAGWFDGDITRAYTQALEARGIPHLLVGGKTFHSREEIETLRAALAAVEWPDDELSVYATLRGSLFAIPDEVLLEYRDAHGRLHPFRQAKTELERLRPVIEGLELLRTLHRGRNRIPVAATIDRLLGAARAHAALVLRPSGEQVLANVLQVAELARQYEERGGISFRGFVERLDEEAERGEAAEAPILEEGSDGVRLMTVHKAKGLEFPVVILADATTKLARKEAARFLDKRRGVCAVRIAGWSPAELLDHEQTEIARDNAEGVRLAYVAATRARDLLVVPAIGDDPRGKWEAWERWWISPLHNALYPQPAGRRTPLPSPGSPEFGEDSVETRPDERERDSTNIAPGMHLWPGSHAVTWWDPRLLPRNAREQSGLRQRDLLSKDADPAMVARDLENHRLWRESRDAAIAAGSVPSLCVARVTAAARDRAMGAAHVEVVAIGRGSSVPTGRGFGSLVHAVLAAALGAASARVDRIAMMQARVLGCSAEEADAAASVVESALAHPFFQRVRKSKQIRRETPVTHRQPDGTLLEGVVDLAFEEDGAWIVADFKTDREIEDRLDDYRRQVSLYTAAVAAATGQAARGVLVRL
jgi:ATP-dependent exoDNAse (exonuclease V) beta subunit